MIIRTATTAETPEGLLNDLRALISDAEKMLNADAETDRLEADATRCTRFAAARGRCADILTQAKVQLTAGAKFTDHAIRANPYQALVCALGAGLVVGALVGRRSH
jgi:ElaB/YqjD/DUF883 family membrane-anchored ribosome-binding protein